MMHIDIGLADNARNAVAEELKSLLADTYALYLKTHNYHWNVTGALFKAVHELTEEQYQSLAAAVDEIAERIRMLGPKAPGSFSAYAKLSSLSEADENFSAHDMIADLVKSHEALIKAGRKMRAIAEKAGDETTVGLIDERLTEHEKQAWMLRTLLED